MPVSTDNWLDQLFQDVSTHLSNPATLVDGAEAVATDAAEAGAATTAVEVSVDAVAGILAAFSAPIVAIVALVLAILIAVLMLLQSHLETMARNVPLVGKPLAAWVHGAYWFLDNAATAVRNLLAESINRMWHSWVSAFHSMLIALMPVIIEHVSTTHMVRVVTTETGLASIQTEINRINAEIAHINSTVHGNTTIYTVNTAPLVQAIQVLEHDVHVLHNNEIQFYTELKALDGTLSKVETAMSTLQSNQGALHEVQVSFGDVVVQVQQLEQIMQQRLTNLEGSTQYNREKVVQLSPLTILLQPGMKGLRNLRKLEDNPCQCSHLPSVHLPSVEMLALLDWSQHG